MTWPLPPMSTGEYRLLEIASGKVDGNLEGYAFLYRWGHSGSTAVFGGPRAPVLGVSIVLDSADKLDEAKARLEGSVRDALYMVARPGEERDSPRWVRQYEGKIEAILARWEGLAGRNSLYSDFQQYDPTSSVSTQIDELVRATPGAARAVAAQWLSPKRARYLLIEPSGASDVGRGGAFDARVEQHGVPVDRASADRPLPAPPRSLWPKPERYTLDNGLTVVLWPHGATPLVRGRLVVDAGALDDPFGAEGVSQLVGASSVFSDAMVFDERSLANRVDELVRSVASELRLPGYGLSDEERDYLRARLDGPRVRERAAYELDVLVALYGEGHPYARNAMTIGGVTALSHDSVQEWARRYITPRNTTLVIAGAFDPELVKKHVAYNVEHVAPGSRMRDIKVEPRTTPQFIAGTTSKPSATVELDVHYIGGRGIDDEHASRLVLEAVLGVQLRELRAKRAITYGVQASYEPRRTGGMWTIRGQVDAARAAEASAAIIGILDQMRRDPETYRGAFVLARQKIIESLLVRSNSAIDVAESLVALARFGLADDYFDTVARTVAAMTLVEFHAFLGKELDVSTQVFGAFGNAEPVKAAVAAARAVESDARPSPIVDPFR
ncbi:MAG: insulinase family protein [Deltaproteobacteria bacterium]|nr:insulinase family protein [Deltaproteobacteria bacterium]